MVIISPLNGEVQSAQVFKTNESSKDFDDFITYDIETGDIILVAFNNDAIGKLSENAKEWFENMGSKEIWRLKPGQAFAFIGTKGGFRAVEKRGQS